MGTGTDEDVLVVTMHRAMASKRGEFELVIAVFKSATKKALVGTAYPQNYVLFFQGYLIASTVNRCASD